MHILIESLYERQNYAIPPIFSTKLSTEIVDNNKMN